MAQGAQVRGRLKFNNLTGKPSLSMGCHSKTKILNLNEESSKAALGRGKGRAAPCFVCNEPKKTGACSAWGCRAAKTLIDFSFFFVFNLKTLKSRFVTLVFYSFLRFQIWGKGGLYIISYYLNWKVLVWRRQR
jgi:hypothetical protein